MLFANGQILWFLLIVPVAGILTWKLSRHGTTQRLLLVLTRMICLAAAILALARPMLTTISSGKTTVALLDLSPSISNGDIQVSIGKINSIRKMLRPGDNLVTIAFGNRIQVIDSFLNEQQLYTLRTRLAVPIFPSDPQLGGTTLAAAVRLAGAYVSEGQQAEIILYTDGQQTRGDALSEISKLASRGIQFTANPIQPIFARGTTIKSIDLPASTGAGETVPIKILVQSIQDINVRIEVLQSNASIISSSDFQIKKGDNQINLPTAIPSKGLNELTVKMTGLDGQELSESFRAACFVREPYRLVLVAGPEDRGTVDILSKLLGPAAISRTMSSDQLDKTTTFAANELIVMANVPRALVSDRGQQNIINAVSQGSGLLVTGGTNAFGPGGWNGTALAEILPVRMPQQLERQDPSATAVFIIDTSGSMTGPRISLAKEVVRLALKRLQPQDKAGIVEFYGSKRWAAPIQSAANHLDLNRALNRLTAGGGTVILPAIEEASFALKNVNTRTRHVIILTDGGVESGPFESLTRKMTDDGITVSTVLVGPSQHSEFLASIAQWGRGRFYHAPDRFNLPEIILHQPQSNSPPPLVQTPSSLSVRDRSDVTNGIDFTNAPLLTGYVRTEPKPLSELLVAASGRDPVIASWRYGAGRVAVLTVDLASTQSGDFAHWPALATLVSNLGRSMHGSSVAFDIVPIIRPIGLEVQITAKTKIPVTPIKVELFDKNGKSVRSQVVQPLEAGRWNVLFRNLSPDTYEIRATAPGLSNESKAAITILIPREDSALNADSTFFNAINDFNNLATSVQQRSNVKSLNYQDIWPVLVLISIAMFLMNIYVRRRSISAFNPRKSANAMLLLSFLCLSPQLLAASSATTQTSESPIDIALENGNFEAAADILRSNLATDSMNPVLLTRLSSICELKGDNALALEYLKHAVELEPDSSSLAHLRLSVLKMDLKQSLESVDGSHALAAAIFGHYDLIGKHIDIEGKAIDPSRLLLYGSTCLRLNDPLKAQHYFNSASSYAVQPRDRRFIAERLIASARKAGTLGQLADSWIAGGDGNADRLLPLISVLRELKRVDDILLVWKRSSPNEAERELLISPRFVAEVLAATRDAGRIQDAEKVCRSALENEPQNERWLTALASILLEQDRIDEADTLFRTSAESSQSAAAVLRIVHAAQSLGRDDVAISAALMLKRFGRSNEVSGILIKAQIELHRGNREIALSALNVALQLAIGDAKQLSAVAEMFEQSGDRAKAIELYRKCVQGGEDVQQRLAWLLEQDGKLIEAQSMWSVLCQSAGSPARRREAQQRLLDLSSRTGTTADLALEIEDRLTAGKASADDLSVLIDIYTGAKDPAAAAEILSSFKHLAGSEKDSLDQLAKLYLKCGRFGQADRTLRQLLLADSEHAIDTLQELAVLAIERKRPLDAQNALEQIAILSGSDSSTAELRAGVYEQLGQFTEAADEYRRAVKVNPDQIEDWVLWAAAMNQAGKKEIAINRLLLLAQEADSDDLFTIAIDGLLNLEAPKDKLQVARRRTIERLVRDGKKLVFYQLIRDLSESIGDTEMSLRTGELSLLVAGEQRTEIIRELITLCKASGQGDRSLELGRTLLAIGDQVPPSSLLDIGRQLLQEHNLVEADRAFVRGIELAGDDGTRMQVAKLYESSGETRLAVETLHPIIRLHPNDVELRARAGGMHEQLGENAAAFEHYFSALNVLLRRGTDGTNSAGSTSKPSVSRNGASISEADQFLDGLTQGLIICARDPKLQIRLLKSVSAAAEHELTGEVTKTVPRKTSDRAAMLRRFAFALHHPQYADELDKLIFQKFPADTAFANVAITARVDWGLLDSARDLAIAMNQPVPDAVRLKNQLLNAGISSDVKNTDEIAIQLPVLIMQGKNDRVKEILHTIDHKTITNKATIRLFLASSLAIADQSQCDLWALQLLAVTEKGKANQVNSAEMIQAIRSIWPVISRESQVFTLARVKIAADRTGNTDKGPLALLAMRMAVMLGESAGEYANWVAGSGAGDGAALHEILQAVTPAERPPLLEKAITATPSDKRRSILLQLLAASDEPFESELLIAYKQFFSGSAEVGTVDRREQITIGNWTKSYWQLPALQFVVETLLKEASDDPQTKISAARGFFTCGNTQQADSISTEVIQSILTGKSQNRLESRVLADAVSVLSPAAAGKILQDISKVNTSKKNLPIEAMLLEQMGHREEALDAYRRSFVAMPSDMELRRLFTDRLEFDYRWVDIVSTFEPYLSDDTVVNQAQRFRLMKAYRQLGRYDDAAAMMFKEDGPLRQLQRLQMGVEAGARESLLPEFKSFHVDNRWQRRTFTPYMQPQAGAGGLIEFILKRKASTSRVSIYDLLSGAPWAYDEMSALLNAALPKGSDLTTLTIAIGKACENDTVFNRAILDLENARKSGALTSNDRLALLAIARAGRKLPVEFNEYLVQSLFQIDPTDVTALSSWADALKSSGNEKLAESVTRWIVCNRIVNTKPTPNSRLVDSSTDDDTTANSLLLLASLPGPSDAIDDAKAATILQQLVKIDLKAAESQLDLMRRSGRVTNLTHSRLANVWAQFACQRGDVEEFARRRSHLIELTSRRSTLSTGDDLRDLLSENATEAAIQGIITELQQKSEFQPAIREAAVRYLCRLGLFCKEHSLDIAATNCFEASVNIATEPGEHMLWIADLARQLGKDSYADTIEIKMLRQHTLPPQRIENILQRVKNSIGAEEEKSLRIDVEKYCQLHPNPKS